MSSQLSLKKRELEAGYRLEEFGVVDKDQILKILSQVLTEYYTQIDPVSTAFVSKKLIFAIAKLTGLEIVEYESVDVGPIFAGQEGFIANLSKDCQKLSNKVRPESGLAAKRTGRRLIESLCIVGGHKVVIKPFDGGELNVHAK
jgi:hypothetical protein